ncbi:thermonuclease family protein [Micrococcus luteus]|uniref:thermonuclease family protein n=1 Tax=Micrococcus luteus TaxID=1270 RepID=UPI00289083D8|nr:thermonuclease family protein [Micrococcus luteus]MDT1991628.1 thermonuclease family protein [Micrococcus luteus]
MPPRLRGRASLAAVALSALLLTGCTPSEPAEAGTPSAGDGGAPSAQPVVAQPSSTLEAGDPATVVRVVDGDTVVVRKDGREETVRLLNIDTPETKHPNKAVQCLGPEATQALETLLRPGDDVVLRYDLERTDRYGRTLAGVFEDEMLVNAEIARLGLGVPVVFEPNRRFYPEVLAAWNEAEGEQAGLHQPDLACSLPVITDAAAAEPDETLIGELATVLAVVAAGEQPWMEVHYKDELDRVQRVVDDHRRRADEAAEQAREAERQADQKAAAERKAAAEQAAAEEARAAEAAREAEEARAAEAAREAEEQSAAEAAAAEARAAEEAAAEAAESRAEETEVSTWADTSSSGSGSNSNKAPNRCYAPGGETFEYCGDEESSSDSTVEAATSGDTGSVAGSGGVCPDGYPVKANDNSGIYHVPGQQHYGKTNARNCYASAAAAQAAGYRAAKR